MAESTAFYLSQQVEGELSSQQFVFDQPLLTSTAASASHLLFSWAESTNPIAFPGFGYFDYELFLRYRQGNNATIPTDEIDSLPLVQFFDEDVYLLFNPEVATAIAEGLFSSAYEHFVAEGLFEGLTPSILYSEDFYLANNPDVQQAVEDGVFESGLEHFLNIGHRENRDPSIQFDQEDYLLRNPDVAAGVEMGLFGSAFEHYIEFGANEEGRFLVELPEDSNSAPPYDPTPLYNEAFYLRTNSDIADAILSGEFIDGFDHFVQFGQYELRDPSADFDHSAYVAGNTDVQAAVNDGIFESGFDHYVQFGRFEHRPFVSPNLDSVSLCGTC